MILDPKKLMVGRELHAGYLRHDNRGGPQTYHVEVVEAATGFLVYFEAVTSQTRAIARATELTSCFALCRFVGQVEGNFHGT